MKKSLLTIILTAIAALHSCMNEDTRDRIDNDQAFATATDLFNNTVANLYNHIGGSEQSEGLQGTTHGIYDISTFTTDEAILPTRGGDWYDGGLWLSLYYHIWDAGTSPIEGAWNYLYKVIMMCNEALGQIDQHSYLLTDSQYMAYTAEAKALRALFYYYLLDLFGNVPYVTTTSTEISQITQVSRSTLFHNIWNELTEQLPYLADERSNFTNAYYGRMTRHVAWFILAKMALNAEVWTDDHKVPGREIKLGCEGHTLNAWEACIYWCDKLQDKGYRLEEVYAFNFSVNNETSVENIFVIPMDKNLYGNVFKYLFRSRHYNHGSALGMDAENGTSATISTVKTYGYGTDNIDHRYEVNFFSDTVKVDSQVVRLDNGDPLIYRPLEVRPILTGSFYEKTAGARMSKYEIDRTAYSDGMLQDNDIVLFRYADVMLMRAEARVRNGEDGSEDFYYVRVRAGMEEREPTLDNILKERLMELQWEGWRRQDLIRYDLFHRAYDERPQLSNEADRHTIVFPIPSRAINLNNRLKQNPGY